jgi:dipeptidyl-peptidase-3
MARAGIAALQFWDPNSRKWGQPHMRARFAILQSFLSAGPEFCKLEHTKEDLSDLQIYLDRNKIQSHGRKAVNDFLQKLHIFKSTADLEAGTELYDRMTNVDDWYRTKVRPEVIRQAKPRKVFVQANTFLEGDGVALKEYDATPEGIIQSFVDRDYI